MANYRLRFTRLQGTNVCSYERFDIPLSGQGTVLLTGINGSGKSTPWYALTHLLYFLTTKGLSKRAMINVHNPRNYWVRVDFELDGVPYAIEQYQQHNVLGTGMTIYRKGENITPHGERETKAYIPELLKMDRQNFLSRVFLSQEHTHVLVEGKPSEKAEHLQWIFGLASYKLLSDAARRNTSDMKQQIGDVERLEEELKDLESHLKKLSTLTKLTKELASMGEERKTLEREIEVLEGKRTGLADQVTKIEIREDLVDELRDLGVEGAPTVTDVAELKAKMGSIHDSLATCRNQLDHAKKAALLREELVKYRDLAPVADLRKDLEEARSQKLLLSKVTLPEAEKAFKFRNRLNKITEEADLADLEEKEEEQDRKLRKLEARVKTIRHQLKRGVCPTCKKPWKGTVEDIKALEEELSDARVQLDQASKQYHAAHARAEDARVRVSLTKKLKDLPEQDPQDIEVQIEQLMRQEKGLRADLTIAEERESLRSKLRDAPADPPKVLKEKVKALEDDLRKARSAYERTSKAFDLLRRIAKLPLGDLQEIKKKLETTESVLKSSRDRVSELGDQISGMKQDIQSVKSLEERRTRIETAVVNSRQALRDSKIWASLRDGFTYLLRVKERRLLKRVTQELPSYLIPLFGSQSNWLHTELCKEEGGVEMRIMSGDKELPAKGPSPGQRAKLGLALLFALRDMYATNTCNLLILDEPLWKIDEETRPAFLELLHDIRQKVETLIITTHEAEIKGHAWDHRWEASIEQGISTLSMR
jgi:DNA repair exonuclease SbcCD ATPase subunit